MPASRTPSNKPNWQTALEETTQAALAALVRAEVAVAAEGLEPTRGSEIVRGAEEHTWLTSWRWGEEPDELLLQLPPGLLFPVVGRMLGGRLEEPVTPRAMTEIEQRVARRAHQVLAQALAAAFGQVCQRDLSLTLVASGAAVEPQDRPLIRCGLLLEIGPHSATLVWGLPVPLVRELEQGPAAPVVENSEATAAEQILSVTLARVRISSDHLQTLAAGDILATDQTADVAATVEIDGTPRFTGQPGTIDGQKAVEITGPHPE